MDNKLNFNEARELNHRFLAQTNLDKKKILREKLIMGTINHIKEMINNNYKNYNLGLYELNDLYQGAIELWIQLLDQDILYQVDSFDDEKITNYIFDKLPSTLAINELPSLINFSLIIDFIYEYVSTHDYFDEKESIKVFKKNLQTQYNIPKEEENKLINYFYNRNYEIVKDIIKNYLDSKKEVTKDDIKRSINVLSQASIDNSNIDNIYVKTSAIEDLFKEKNPEINELMFGLTPMERELVNYSYGINNYEQKNLIEVAQMYGEDYSFILEIYATAIEKMKAYYYCKYGCVDKNKGR